MGGDSARVRSWGRCLLLSTLVSSTNRNVRHYYLLYLYYWNIINRSVKLQLRSCQVSNPLILIIFPYKNLLFKLSFHNLHVHLYMYTYQFNTWFNMYMHISLVKLCVSSGSSFINHCLSFCLAFVLFVLLFGLCIVCPSIYGLWLHLLWMFLKL